VDYPLLNIFWTMFIFFMWILWFALLFRVIGDLFRDHSTSGWAKAGWMAVLVLVPFLGILIYLIVRGQSMSEREMARVRKSQEAYSSARRDAAPPTPTTDELVKLAQLKNHGDITPEEYEHAKAKVLH
jgi:hypothetical protein